MGGFRESPAPRVVAIVERVRYAAVVVVALLATACSASDDSQPSATSAPPVTAQSIQDVDVSSLAVRRAPFCSALDPAVVEAALGSPVSGTSDYSSGDEARLTEDVQDVAHEYSCTVLTEAGDVAVAWVFAPPITETWADGLVSASLEGCQVDRSVPTFGSPTAGWRCRRDGQEVLRIAGLFGDAWLTCEVRSRGADDLAEATDRWCATAATAAAS